MSSIPRRIILPAKREFSLTVRDGKLTVQCAESSIGYVTDVARQLLGLKPSDRLIRKHLNLEEWSFRTVAPGESLPIVEVP